ncbi:CASP C terminal-domain-containing protein [Auriculariales sp. MPI-PUGE-AT-0066]|nr:CASP C terminal-domain-containing protein [Auriculariales sp. MPI-PUGE-AT-0066]
MTAQHNFSDALATWKEINLSELQKTLDEQGLEIVENQKESVLGRKSLADRTKEFKKIPDEAKVEAFKGLLKGMSYQTEIDSLTRRGKASENAFLNVYKILAEAPDPYPLLDVAVDQAVKVAEADVLQSELQRLREDNADLKRRLTDVPSLETARKNAETRADQLEEKMEEMLRERVAAKENELNAIYDERLRNYEDRERDLQRQVTLVKEQIRDLRTSNESTQAKLLNHSERQDQEVVAKLAEMDMVVADLERANARVVAVERRNEILRAEIESVRSGSDTAERCCQVVASQISELEADRDGTSSGIDGEEARGRAHARTLGTDSEADNLKTRLKKYADYDEIKRELDIMKYVEFAGGDDDGWASDAEGNSNSQINGYDVHMPNPNADKAAHGKSLEALLAAKNKRMLEELTKFRITHGELEASLRTAEEELSHSKAEVERQTALNEKLENDLLQLNSHTPSGLNVSETDGGLAAVLKPDTSHGTRGGSINFTSGGAADTSILPIVTSQRDRFRARNAELEEELRKQAGLMGELRAEVKTLQSDNLKLYEKVRYMQSYRDGPSGQEGASGTLDALPSAPSGSRALAAGSAAADVGKYHARYVESMNPFEVFRGREAQHAVQALNPLERAVLTLTRHILGNRRSRTAFIVYAALLHVMVVIMGYSAATGCKPGAIDNVPRRFQGGH